MFSRNADRPAPPGTAPVPGVRDVSPPPMPYSTAPAQEITTIARADRLEGTVRAVEVLRVLGQVEGRIEATTVVIEEGARVNAEVIADEVIISGEYHGKLLCRQRLEVRPSGRVSGQVETFRLMLHEGAAVDGEMKMLKQPGLAEAEAIRNGSVRGAPDVAPRGQGYPQGAPQGAPMPAPAGSAMGPGAPAPVGPGVPTGAPAGMPLAPRMPPGVEPAG
ncbi:MAG: polymer-forming cytoskeletal protein [Chloroflexota bacterium]